MALSSTALISVAEAEAHLGLSAGTDTTLLEGLINGASAGMEKFCQTNFVISSVTEAHWGRVKRIYLRRYPVTTVTSITDPASNTVPSTDYYVQAEEGILQHFGLFPTAQNTNGQPTQWTIAYSAGRYANTAAVAEDLKTACKQLVSLWYERRTSGVGSVGVGGLSVSYTSPDMTSGYPIEVRMALSPYMSNLV